MCLVTKNNTMLGVSKESKSDSFNIQLEALADEIILCQLLEVVLQCIHTKLVQEFLLPHKPWANTTARSIVL